jgi:hypothetical protein
MDAGSNALLVLGFLTFGLGGLARTYMNRQIRKRMPSRSIWASTEIGYWRLVQDRQAPKWPLFVTLVCLPVGVVLVFTAVIISSK